MGNGLLITLYSFQIVTGDCKCKEKFYGKSCEKFCPKVLKCSGFLNCTCESSLEDKIEEIKKSKVLIEEKLEELKNEKSKLKDHLDMFDMKHTIGSSHFLESIETIESNISNLTSKMIDLTKDKNNFRESIEQKLVEIKEEIKMLEQNKTILKENYDSNKNFMHKIVEVMDNREYGLNVFLIFSFIWLIALSAIIYWYNLKNKNMKENFSKFSLRDSTDTNEFNNAIYMDNLTNTVKSDTYESLKLPSNSPAKKFFANFLFKNDEKSEEKDCSVESRQLENKKLPKNGKNSLLEEVEDYFTA